MDQYKKAINFLESVKNKAALNPEEELRVASAKLTVESGRAHFEKVGSSATSNPEYKNKIEEHLGELRNKRRQRSVDEVQNTSTNQPSKKRKSENKNSKQKPTGSIVPLASEVVKNHLTVALIDRLDECGRITQDRWKTVEMKLVQRMVGRLKDAKGQPMPSFDGAGWYRGVKIIKCVDKYSLDWCVETVKTLEGLWVGAALEVVEWKNIPSKPSAKVVIPITLPSDEVLELLKAQNPTIPTEDWVVLKEFQHGNKTVGSVLILQINKQAEDLLYNKKGKMAFGMSCVYLRLKKRNVNDDNPNTLEAGEVEKDLGDLTLAATNMSLEEDGETATENVAGPSNKSAPQ